MRGLTDGEARALAQVNERPSENDIELDDATCAVLEACEILGRCRTEPHPFDDDCDAVMITPLGQLALQLYRAGIK